MTSSAVRSVQRQLRRALSVHNKVIAGQPTPDTHSYLLEDGEIQPGISAAEFSLRRQRLAQQLPANGIAIFQSAPQQYMAGVIPYPYRPDSNFQYLTGIIQPGPLGAIDSHGKYILFYPDHDAWRETWDGARLQGDACIDVFGADEAYPISEMSSKLTTLMRSASAIVTDIQELLETSIDHQGKFQPLKNLIHRMRWVKSGSELKLMKKSAEIAGQAMVESIKATRDGVNEHTIAAVFEYQCKIAGAQRMAYPPVVAGGVNALTIHYSRNDQRVMGGQLLKLDGGCELYGYCSDVTRTWPVNGKFSSVQADLYDAVYETHQSLLAMVCPGMTLRHLHHASIRLLSKALADLGIVKKQSVESIINNHVYRTYYPHSVGHWLGMDTHDVATNSHDRPFEAGVVLTVEPGLYIPDNKEEYGEFAGIGIRLEDDVAVTVDGAEVLSSNAPMRRDLVEEIFN